MIDLTFESIHRDDVKRHDDSKVAQDGATDWTYVTIDIAATERRAIADLQKRINPED